MIKFKTFQEPDLATEKVSEKPSETRQSDYESIESMFARFIGTGMVAPRFRLVTDEERDVFDNSTDVDDLEDEDILVRKAFVDSVAEELAKKKKKVEQPTQEKSAPENTATEPENASK